jgi:hypothetical protein
LMRQCHGSVMSIIYRHGCELPAMLLGLSHPLWWKKLYEIYFSYVHSVLTKSLHSISVIKMRKQIIRIITKSEIIVDNCSKN